MSHCFNTFTVSFFQIQYSIFAKTVKAKPILSCECEMFVKSLWGSGENMDSKKCLPERYGTGRHLVYRPLKLFHSANLSQYHP